MKTINSTLAVFGALLCMSPAIAQETPVDADSSGRSKFVAESGERQSESYKQFSMSEEQQTKLRALKDQFSVQTAEKKAQLKADQHKLFELMSQATIDRGAVSSLHAKVNSLRTELSDARLNHMLSVSEVFTPEQRAQMRKRMLSHSFKGGHSWGGKSRGCQGSGSCE